MIERYVTSTAFNSDEKSILRESERKANREEDYIIQLNIATMIDCAALLSNIVQI